MKDMSVGAIEDKTNLAVAVSEAQLFKACVQEKMHIVFAWLTM